MGELAMTGWRERLDLSTGLLPSIGAYRTWSRWLVAHSRWVRETRGDPAIAVEDWLIALRLARQLHRLQLLLPQMVASGMERDVASEMRLAVIEGIGEVDTAALFRDAAEEPDIKADDQQRRTEHHQHREPAVAPGLDRHRTDLDLVLDQESLEPVVDEQGQGRREDRRGARLGLHPLRQRRAARRTGAAGGIGPGFGGPRPGHRFGESARPGFGFLCELICHNLRRRGE